MWGREGGNIFLLRLYSFLPQSRAKNTAGRLKTCDVVKNAAGRLETCDVGEGGKIFFFYALYNEHFEAET